MKRTLTVLAVLSACCLRVVTAAAADAPSPVGRQVAGFSLQDYRGAPHSLADLQDKPLVVLAFIGTECPLAKLYMPKLAALAKQYEDRGVAVLGISSNQQDSITELAAFARAHEVTFPILKDAGNRLADECGAQRTPEVIVLDAKRTVRYAGKIDDKYVPGVQRNKASSDDLKQALDELLSGKEVSNPRTQAAGCLIGRVREAKANPAVTYSNQVARILQDRCVECHRPGEIAPFSLTSYDEAAGWAEMIEEVVRENRMPPWHADPKHGQFVNDRRLTDDEKRILRQWAADGAPQGDPADLPKPREYVTGWQLPREPDQVFYMEKPYDVPAEGEVKYQHFTIDPGFTEDKWVSAAQVMPGNRAVVHHIIVFLQTPGSAPGQAGRQHFAAYVPGLVAEPYGPGRAKRIPAGSKLVFQVHYTPVGTPQTDRSQVGFSYAQAGDVKEEVVTNVAGDAGFEIPPYAPRHRVEATSRAYSKDVTLLSLAPHMHFRGSAFMYEAVFPDGTKETLLDVPHYDFNWQTSYELKEPRLLPKGTKLHCVAYFDNSPDNLANPDPSSKVRWGDQTWEEMMLGYYEIAFSGSPPPGIYDNRAGGGVSGGEVVALRRLADADPKEVLARMDVDKDGKISKEEFPEIMRLFFGKIDADKSGFVDVEELGVGLKLLAKPR